MTNLTSLEIMGDYLSWTRGSPVSGQAEEMITGNNHYLCHDIGSPQYREAVVDDRYWYLCTSIETIDISSHVEGYRV